MPLTSRAGRVSRSVWIAAVAVLLVAVLAVVLAATGAVDRWTGSEAGGGRDDVCAGAVSVGDLAGLLGGEDVREGKRPDAGAGGGLAACAVERDGDGVEFRIGWSDEPALAMRGLGRTGPLKPPAVPFGHGWDGVLVPGSDTARAAVLLACEGGPGRTKGGGALVVTADVFRAGGGVRTPERAGHFAEAVTRAARGAAGKWGCEAEFGKRVERVNVPEAVWPDAVPVGKARGACRALAPFAGELRAKAGVTGAVESPSGRAPLADCQLVDAKGESVYWLTTYHGPFVRGETKAEDPDTATFTCPRYHGPGRTALRPLRTVAGDASLRRTLLRTYTEGEVSAYGCGKPDYRR